MGFSRSPRARVHKVRLAAFGHNSAFCLWIWMLRAERIHGWLTVTGVKKNPDPPFLDSRPQYQQPTIIVTILQLQDNTHTSSRYLISISILTRHLNHKHMSLATHHPIPQVTVITAQAPFDIPAANQAFRNRDRCLDSQHQPPNKQKDTRILTSVTMSTSPSTTLRQSAPHSQSQSQSLRQAAIKKNMSVTQTYYLAHKARAKLSREAAQPDHDLRLLVGHANLLDSLMLELADAEREQERWFNQSVRGATKAQDRHVQWADNIVEEAEEEFDSDAASDSSDSDDYDSEDEDIEMANTVSLRSLPAKATSQQLALADEMEEDDDLEEDYAQLGLVRTISHSSPPPELVDHDSESSDDESMPPSPPQPELVFSEKAMKEESEQEGNESFYEEGFYLPARNPARLVAAISVY
ncbi:hypothetical protein G7046_g8795 [Stylonectria norvegica]|nr:hypothetical protein G7046_g8795 [Stylonectria norvegica]